MILLADKWSRYGWREVNNITVRSTTMMLLLLVLFFVVWSSSNKGLCRRWNDNITVIDGKYVWMYYYSDHKVIIMEWNTLSGHIRIIFILMVTVTTCVALTLVNDNDNYYYINNKSVTTGWNDSMLADVDDNKYHNNNKFVTTSGNEDWC